MREIKFRAWTGSKMEHNVMVGFLGAFYVQGIDPGDAASMSPLNTIYSEQTPVMQYTGLKDKNGVEIYEGDIVTKQSLGYSYEVVFKSSKWLFARIGGNPNWGREHIEPNYMGWYRSCEVIGNIYENPELLGAKI